MARTPAKKKPAARSSARSQGRAGKPTTPAKRKGKAAPKRKAPKASAKPRGPRASTGVKRLRPDYGAPFPQDAAIVPCGDDLVGQGFDLRTCKDVPRRGGGTARRCTTKPVVVAGCAAPLPGKRARRFFTVEEGMRYNVKDRDIARAMAEGAAIRARYGGEMPVALAPRLRKPSCNALAKRVLAGKPVPPDAYERCDNLPDAVEPGGFAPIPDFDPAEFEKTNDRAMGRGALRTFEVYERRSGQVVARVDAVSAERAVRAYAQDVIGREGSRRTGSRGREVMSYLATFGARAESKANHHHGWHAPGDPLAAYMPLPQFWTPHPDGRRTWDHPGLGWVFTITPQGLSIVQEGERLIMQMNPASSRDNLHTAYTHAANWYRDHAAAFLRARASRSYGRHGMAFAHTAVAAKANGRAKGKGAAAPQVTRGRVQLAPGQSYVTRDPDPFAGQRVTGDDYYGLVRNPVMPCDGSGTPAHIVGGDIVTRGRVTGGVRRREIRDGLRPAPVRKLRAGVTARAASAMYEAPSQGGYVEVTGEVEPGPLDDDGPSYGGPAYGDGSAYPIVGEAVVSPPPPPPIVGEAVVSPTRGGASPWSPGPGARLALPAPRPEPAMGLPRPPVWLADAEAARRARAALPPPAPRFGAPHVEDALRIDPEKLVDRVVRLDKAWREGLGGIDYLDILSTADAMTFQANRVTPDDVWRASIWSNLPESGRQKLLRPLARKVFESEVILTRAASRDMNIARERAAARREQERLQSEAIIAADRAAMEREIAEREPAIDVDPGQYGFIRNRFPGYDYVKKESVPPQTGWVRREGGRYVTFTDSHARMLALQIAQQEGARPKAAPAPSRVPVLTYNAESRRFEVIGDIFANNLWQKLKDAGFRTMPIRGKTDPVSGKQAFTPWGTEAAVIASTMAQYADAAAKEQLAKIAGVIADSRAAEGVDCGRFPAPPGLKYLPFQCAGIAFATARQNTLIGDDMGLGKTVQVLGVVNADPSLQTVLVVGPANAMINWEREAKKWLVRPTSIFRVDDTSDTIPPNAQFVICNAEKLIDREFKQSKDKKTGKVTPGYTIPSKVRQQLMARQWDLFVVDEAQKYKARDGKQSASIWGMEGKNPRTGQYGIIEEGLTQRAQRLIVLTGTPVPNRVIELWNMVHALAPNDFNNFMAFGKRYANAHKTRFGWDFTGSSNLDELQERLRSTIMIRRLKSQVLKELPAKTRQLVPLPIDAVRDLIEQGARALYARMLQDEADGRDTSAFDGIFGVDTTPEEIVDRWFERIATMREEMSAAERRGDKQSYREIASKLRMFTKIGFESMSKSRVELAVRKVPYAIEHIDQLLQGGTRKVVVMAHHHVVQDAMLDAFLKLYGPGSAVIHRGGFSMDDKQEAVDAFMKDPNVRLFIGSIGASGTAITLTEADTMVFVEFSWVPSEMSQAEDRIYRIGQKMPVLIQHLAFDGTLDAKMIDVLIKKQEIADLALDETTKRALLEDLTPPVRQPRDDMERWALGYMQSALAGGATIKPMSRWQENTARAALETLGAEGGLTDRQWKFLAQNAAALSGASQRQVAEARGEVVRAATSALESWAAEAIGILSGQDTDRARERNGVGFSASDTYTGHTLNVLIGANMMTDRTWREAVEVARHYPAQVGYPPGYTPPAAGGAAAKPKRAPAAKKNGVHTVYGHALPNPLGVRWVPPSALLRRPMAPGARRSPTRATRGPKRR